MKYIEHLTERGMSAKGVLKEMNPRGMPVCRVETMATMSRPAQRGWLLLGTLSAEGGKGQGMLSTMDRNYALVAKASILNLKVL